LIPAGTIPASARSESMSAAPAEPMITSINHVCIVTGDLDRAVKTWSERYGVGPWDLYRYGPGTMDAVVDGTPVEFAIRVALCDLQRGTRLEIIQPLDDRGLYAQSLAERGGADHLHHVRFNADFDAAIQRAGELDVATLLDGRFQGRDPATTAHAKYLDTRADLGLLIEVADMSAGYEAPVPEATYPPAAG
jgi:methylmalonyl-CoA/ethylmalonyl-CoA epimerase